jgi:hypothetical protein
VPNFSSILGKTATEKDKMRETVHGNEICMSLKGLKVQ